MLGLSSCPVNIPWDITAGAGTHGLVLPPPAVPIPPAPTAAIEMITTMLWTAGFVLGKNKFTDTVFHKGGFIMLEGHDIGPLIPDVTIPPTNIWYLKMWPLSSRKVMFSASTVKMQGKGTGCAAIWPPYTILLSCGEPVSLPASRSLLSNLNTVKVGLTWGDFFAGVLTIVISIGLDLIFKKIGDYFGGKEIACRIFQNTWQGALSRVGHEVSNHFIRNQLSSLAKNTLSGLAGAGISALTGTGPPQIKIGIGNSWVGGEGVFDVSGGGQHGAEGHAFGWQQGAGSSAGPTGGDQNPTSFLDRL
ncbi:MAG: hypothetical protein ACNYWU_05890 [Desulfobacterales bacterium]